MSCARRLIPVLSAALAGITVAAGLAGADLSGFGTSHVGRQAGGSILTPDNQRITPAGQQVPVDGRLISSAIRPQGGTMAALTWQSFNGYLSIIDTVHGSVLQQLNPLGDGTVSFDGPAYSKDGSTLWVPQSTDVVKLRVGPDGTVSSPATVVLDQVPGGDLPSGMALSDDGSKVYVALNAANQLAVIDAARNTVINRIPVGNAPRQVVVKGGTAYVSDEGGRPARPGDYTNPSYGTPIVAQPETGGVTTGAVSVVDLGRAAQTALIQVGLHPSALLAVGPDLLVTNTNDDSVSAIDTRTNVVRQTFNVNPLPQQPVGSAPNGLGMLDATHLGVTLGRDNAVAVYGWQGSASPASFQGLIPVAWYPVGVDRDPATGKIVVTNDKGIGSLGPKQTITQGPYTRPATGHNVYSDVGTVSILDQPSDRALAKDTATVFADNNWLGIAANNQPRRPGVAPVALPANLGEPSRIKHVFLIVKENRTYDQVLGDVARGNGDPALTQFGDRPDLHVTPNQHHLADAYGLLDNLYASGTLSADGHNWLMQADAPDYIEKEFGNFERSYPASGGDALAYQKTGFIWNAVQEAGLKASSWGEYANFWNGPSDPRSSDWRAWYHDALVLEGRIPGPLNFPLGSYKTTADIPSLNRILHHDYPNFNLDIPDQYRADLFLRDLKGSEAKGDLPAFNMLWVMCDHTSGGDPSHPIPVSQVADNDLATGRIIDGISHSSFWKDSAVFVIEDDAQNGTDHVDGHRTNSLVVSPYTRTGKVIPTYYTQINMMRTIEQILGVQPMNQLDLAAEPMRDVFTDTPDLRPYTADTNTVPIDLFPAAATTSAGRAWQAWAGAQFDGGAARLHPDADPGLLDRAIWYATRGDSIPYPGDPTVLTPAQAGAGPGAGGPSRGGPVGAAPDSGG